MPLNTNIALQVRGPEFESPVNQLAKVMQLQGMQQEQGLNRLKMDSYARDQERRNKLLTLTHGWGADTKPEQRVSSLQGAGFFDEADKLEKGVLERRKVENDAFKGKAEVFGKYLGGVKDYTTRVFANPTPESAAAALDAAEQLARGLGLDVSADIASQRRMLAGLQTNEQIKQWAAGHSLNADKLLPIIQKSNTGGATITEAVNPLTGIPTLTGSTANTATPDAVMTDTRTREEGDKNRVVTTRGQNMTDARARERLAFDQGVAVADAGGPTQAALAKQFGKAAPGYRWKADGSQEAIPGGPADVKAGEAGLRRERQTQGAIGQAERVISKVEEALALVGKNTAGLGGSVMARVPGTEAVDLRGALETIKSNLGFAELQAMREASPTGGALGAIAVQELIALQSTVASLDPSQSPAQLRANLAQVKKHYDNWKTTLEGRMPGQKPKAEPGQLGSGTAPVGVPSDIGALLNKYGRKN